MRFPSLLPALAVLWALPLAQAARPNVLFILCDDLNDTVGYLGGHPQAQTPRLDALAASGTAFTRAYCNNPICAPSRASLFTGIHPHTSRNFFFDPWYENGVLVNSRTLMEHFHAGGYKVAGAGKLMHHFKEGVWPEFGPAANVGPHPWNGTKSTGHPSVPEPFRSADPIDGSLAPLSDVPYAGTPGAGWSHYPNSYKPFRYVSDDDRDLLPDETYAQWAVERIARHAADRAADPSTPPLFLAVGFIRPHTPLYAPKAYFDKFPLADVQLPKLLQGDAADTRYRDIIPAGAKGLRYFETLGQAYGSAEDGLRRYIQAYLACTAFLDDQVGKVLDALEVNGMADDTIVVMTSDNAYVMGEKEYLFKDAPWEESAQVPLIIRAPGIGQPGGRPGAPVSLVDLYPTLVDLCGLDPETRKTGSGAPLDGHSLRPLLADPDTRAWGGPDTALTMVHAVDTPASPLQPDAESDPRAMHYSLRSEDFRYIRYNDGSEELYDHRNDPHEWTNLAADPAQEPVLQGFRDRLEAFLPDHPWRDTREIVSIQFLDTPDSPAAFDGVEAFGVDSLGTVAGNWNNLGAGAPALLRGNGDPVALPLTRDNPQSFTLGNLRTAFPDGWWAIVYPATAPGAGVDRERGYTLIGSPASPLTVDQFTWTAPEGGHLGGVQLVGRVKPLLAWLGYPITSTGYINTGTRFLSWLWIGRDTNGIGGWKYSVVLRQWLYLQPNYITPGSGAWCYSFDTSAFAPGDQKDDWFFSTTLKSWVRSFAEKVTSGPGWVYVMDLGG